MDQSLGYFLAISIRDISFCWNLIIVLKLVGRRTSFFIVGKTSCVETQNDFDIKVFVMFSIIQYKCQPGIETLIINQHFLVLLHKRIVALLFNSLLNHYSPILFPILKFSVIFCVVTKQHHLKIHFYQLLVHPLN